MNSGAWDQRYATSEYVWTVAVNRFVEQHLAPLEPGTAVDLGAGEGRNAVWLATRGWSVTAVDFSSVALDKARHLAAEHDVALDTLQADVVDYAPEQPVDLVVLAYLQMPSQPRRDLLSRVPAWLATGGTVLVVAHDRANVTAGWGGPSDVDVCYSVDETVTLLDGLTPTVTEVARRPVDSADGERIALDTLVIAQAP